MQNFRNESMNRQSSMYEESFSIAYYSNAVYSTSHKWVLNWFIRHKEFRQWKDSWDAYKLMKSLKLLMLYDEN